MLGREHARVQPAGTAAYHHDVFDRIAHHSFLNRLAA